MRLALALALALAPLLGLAPAGGARARAVSAAQQARALELAGAFLEQPVRGRKRNRALALRLLFHDVFQSRGGDGCVDLSDPDNGGLGDVLGASEAGNDINALQNALASEFGPEAMSRADLWALVATAAVANGPRPPFLPGALPLFYGRRDLADCASAAQVQLPLPRAAGDLAAVDAAFGDGEQGLGMTRGEYTALIAGAHGFGGAALGNSGYAGVWVDATLAGLSAGANDDRFERDFIRALLEVPMRQLPAEEGGKLQWVPLGRDAAARGSFMLNTDMALARDIVVAAQGEESNCKDDSDACAPSPNRDILRAFLDDDGSAFASAFAGAFLKLVRFGAPDLAPADTPGPTDAPSVSQERSRRPTAVPTQSPSQAPPNTPSAAAPAEQPATPTKTPTTPTSTPTARATIITTPATPATPATPTSTNRPVAVAPGLGDAGSTANRVATGAVVAAAVTTASAVALLGGVGVLLFLHRRRAARALAKAAAGAREAEAKAAQDACCPA
jgi:hypothetical protein